MSEIVLTGLEAGEPIGFLAALGLLRVCATRSAFGKVKLGWKPGDGFIAVLVTEAECDRGRLVEELLDHMRNRDQFPTFSGRPSDNEEIGEGVWDDVKVDPEHYRALLRATRKHALQSSREAVDFLAALGSELIPAQNKNEVKPTALHMTSGNQKFLETLRDIASSLDPAEPIHPKAARPPAEAFQEALFGEWSSSDEFSSLGYDPATEAIYALTAAAPTDTGPRSNRAAVWLAVEAIPLFPCFAVRNRLHTRGFDRFGSRFRWPVWENPLSLLEARTALGLSEVQATDLSPNRFRAYGIIAVFESDRVTIGKGYGQFRPGIRCC